MCQVVQGGPREQDRTAGQRYVIIQRQYPECLRGGAQELDPRMSLGLSFAICLNYLISHGPHFDYLYN